MTRITAKDAQKQNGRSFLSRAEWDIVDSKTFLDTTAFAEYALLVQEAIADGAETIAEIKRALGERCIERFLMDALDSLMAIGAIEQIRDVSPIRYRAKLLRPAESKRKFNGGDMTRAHRGADREQVYRERKITA